MGGAIGYQIAYLFNRILPDRKEIDENCRKAGKIITGMRRLWAVIFDYAFCVVLFLFLNGVLFVVWPGFKDYSIYGLTFNWTFFCAFSLIQVLLTKGYTLGHAICRMVLVSGDGSAAGAVQLVKRYFWLWIFTDFPVIIAGWLIDGESVTVNNIAAAVLFLASRIYFLSYFIKEAILRGERPMAHDKLSGTVYMAAELPEKTE